VTAARFYGWLLFFGTPCLALCAGFSGYAQEQPGAPSRGGQPELSLSKSINSREFQGRQYEGEERQIGRGDSLWRILVEEKGLPGQKFRSYLVVIRGLNPQLKNLEILRVGDKIFVPLRLEDAGDPRRRPDTGVERSQPGTATTINYRVKAGEHLYQILRDQLKLTEERKLAQYYLLIKDLNPERKDWDTLVEGEIIRLPTIGTGLQAVTTEAGRTPAVVRAPGTASVADPKKQGEAKIGAAPFDVRQALRAPAKENMPLFAKIVEAVGNEVEQSGEEVVKLKDGTIRFERSAYPVIYNSALRQRLIIDPDGKVPASLTSKLNDPSTGTSILPMVNGVSIQDAVGQLLAGLGYQLLPTDRSVVIQEDGVTFEAKGNWTVLAPEVSNKTQEVYVINVTEQSNEVPDYLQSELAKQGLHLRDVVLPSQSNAQLKLAEIIPPGSSSAQVKNWPREKQEIVDALLLSYSITFGVDESLSVEVGAGMRIDTRADRLFELGGQRRALFFHGVDPEMRKSLQDKQGISTIDLDLRSLSTRELISRMLNLLGDQAVYQEHRFPAAAGSTRDRITVKAWGFQPTKKPMFLTDRQIPAALQRFFFEKGLEIIYFQ